MSLENEEIVKNHRTISKIIQNYKNLETSIVNQLLLETPAHQPTTGSYREHVWKALFEQVIPRKFCIDQGVFILDSEGNISAEVDLAIYDEQYTPYIFNYGKMKFIPIEAAAVVIQCKSNRLRKKELEPWVTSIKALRTSPSSVTRTAMDLMFTSPKTQSSTRPIRILCTTKKDNISDSIASMFDLTISIDKNLTLRKTMPNESEPFDFWYKTLNHFEVKDVASYNNQEAALNKKISNLKLTGSTNKEHVFLTLIFQLNQLLMLINNPMPFPHAAYKGMFAKHLEHMEKEGAAKS